MSKFDILIKGGTVFDGRRNPRFKGDIGVKDGLIAQIGLLDEADADRVLNADGLNVAPGFVDLHTHYDSQLFWDPYCSSSGWHGVTTVVIGNCGFGFAPCKAEERERSMLTMTRNEAVPLASMKAGMPWDWVTFPEFIASVKRTKKSVNIAVCVPLNPLMVWVIGLERAKSGVLPSDAEHVEMARLLNEAMDAGAIGVSAQRMGVGSVQRDYDGLPMATDLMHDETMLVLADVLRRRSEGVIQYTYADIAAALEGPEGMERSARKSRPHIEEVARRSGRPVIVGGAGEAAFDWIKSCRERGLRIYAQGNTVTIVGQPMHLNLREAPNLVDFSMAWCRATVGSIEEIKAKLSDPAVQAELRADLPKLERAFGPIQEWVLDRGKTPETAKFDQTPLGEISKALGKNDHLETFIDLTLADDLATEWYIQFGTKTFLENHKAMADDPYCIPGISDGGAHTKYSTTGNFPTRYLMSYVREHGWHTLEEAHWRLSALPAHCSGLEEDMGTLVVGAPADIVVYDYDRLNISEREKAYDYPGDEWRVTDRGIGYRWVLVNGQVTIEDDKETGAPSGRVVHTARSLRQATRQAAA
jgi:N-acyl-D-aspartate/D-glutamate deacylase